MNTVALLGLSIHLTYSFVQAPTASIALVSVVFSHLLCLAMHVIAFLKLDIKVYSLCGHFLFLKLTTKIQLPKYWCPANKSPLLAILICMTNQN